MTKVTQEKQTILEKELRENDYDYHLDILEVMNDDFNFQVSKLKQEEGKENEEDYENEEYYDDEEYEYEDEEYHDEEYDEEYEYEDEEY